MLKTGLSLMPFTVTCGSCALLELRGKSQASCSGPSPATMIDPISITIITLACSVAAALKSVYDMICKFFKSISNWRLSRMFKEIGSLMQQYKRDGWLPASHVEVAWQCLLRLLCEKFQHDITITVSRDRNYEITVKKGQTCQRARTKAGINMGTYNCRQGTRLWI
ncbi:Methylsterol monooxygenase [Fusarium oxysporum f. sp. albedinis]|nr:Methylsterol monooxygenase [Fusarium oxysporum f. sp. albedinis]